MRIANVIQAILPFNGKMMVQCCLKTKSHWMIQTMMPKRKLSHFVVGKKSKELKRYALQLVKIKHGKHGVKS